MIKIWRDKWLTSPVTFQVQSPINVLSREARVKELFTDDELNQNENLINNIFRQEEAEIIKKIPISRRGLQDKFYWGVSKKCIFIVRSTYHLSQQLTYLKKGETSLGQEANSTWEKIQQLQSLGKTKNFLWKPLKTIIPTQANLQIKKVKCDGACPFCKQELETLIHVMWNCLASRDIQAYSNFQVKKQLTN